MWAANNGVSALPGVASHETVSHSIQFINPVSGVHTNTIESYWNRYHNVPNSNRFIKLYFAVFRVKSLLKEIKGVRRENYQATWMSYVERAIWANYT